MEKYGIGELYGFAMQIASEVVNRRVMIVSILVAIAVFLGVAVLFYWFGSRRKVGCVSFGIALVLSVLAFFLVRGNIDKKATDIGHILANQAITQGVDQARKAQATELQYIHAAVSGYGVDNMACARTVNFKDFCSTNTSYYTVRQINPHDCNCSRSCDSDGENCHESCSTCYDDEYTPWFTFVSKYWVIADTKLKYLHPGVYEMAAGDPNSKPKVFLNRDWRAPQDPMRNIAMNERPGKFNAQVPEFWDRVRQSAKVGGQVVVANFVGPYFHWGLASESTQFAVYDGQYKSLKSLLTLPGPTGVSFQYKDAFGQPAEMKTQLSSKDGDLALDFQGLTVLGVDLNPRLLDVLNKRATEFQGFAGPSKEASIRWFIVSDKIVNQIGGLRSTTTAIKAYLNDYGVWGHFRLAKNLLIVVESVSDDGTRITGRDLETGMPFGNVLVAQRVRLSLESGQPVPLTPENFFGVFQDSYTKSEGGQLTYNYSEMGTAGVVIGMLYEKTPGWVPPDPNSDECSTAPAEHLGFVRYSMCTQQYRESNIQINKDGALLILDGVRSGATSRIPVWYGWVLFVIAVVVAIFTIVQALQEQPVAKRSYSRF